MSNYKIEPKEGRRVSLRVNSTVWHSLTGRKGMRGTITMISGNYIYIDMDNGGHYRENKYEFDNKFEVISGGN